MTLARDYLRTGELTLPQIASPHRLLLAECLRRGVSAGITDSLRASGSKASWPGRPNPVHGG